MEESLRVVTCAPAAVPIEGLAGHYVPWCANDGGEAQLDRVTHQAEGWEGGRGGTGDALDHARPLLSPSVEIASVSTVFWQARGWGQK